jgi:iron-sulfur cluster repair protein YtfE (RIC family)
MTARSLSRSTISADDRVSDVLFAVAGSAPVFARYRMDTCCAGARSLREAADHAGIPLERLLDELRGTGDPALA